MIIQLCIHVILQFLEIWMRKLDYYRDSPLLESSPCVQIPLQKGPLSSSYIISNFWIITRSKNIIFSAY